MNKTMTYPEFWQVYLKAHTKAATRRWHAIGTSLGIVFFIYCLLTSRFLWAPGALVIGYGFAWYSHFFVEGNRPATFGHPFWSFISDFRMLILVFIGKL